MRAMILAAGRGERMGELTKNTPKPLLRAKGKYLIEYSIDSLKQAGIREIVINISYRADQIKAALGNGEKYGVKIFYSEEEERLETGGGICKALPLLGHQPFIVMSSDIITDYPLNQFPENPHSLAHLMMVTNPHFHPNGDFGLTGGRIDLAAKPTLTFASVGVYKPDLFNGCEPGFFRLTKLLLPAIENGCVTGEHYEGKWHNIGTPHDLTNFESSN